MAASASTTQSAHRKDKAGRTLAQTTCLVVGLTLVAVGVLGFFFGGSSFNVGNNPPGEEFIIFEVNGWHNIVHIATGALLLFAAPKGPLAATVLTVFGLTYAVVTVWGFVDGNDVLNLVPVNTADNFLHVGLTLVALFVGFTSGGLMAAGRKEANTRTAV
jgi:hypothetical protein